MKLKISDLKTDRQWRAATGFDQFRFEQLLGAFTSSYFNLYGKSVAGRQADIEVTPRLTSEEELLFFTLFRLNNRLLVFHPASCWIEPTWLLFLSHAKSTCAPCPKSPVCGYAAGDKSNTELALDGFAARTNT